MRDLAILLRLQDTTAQIRVRGAMLLLLLMVVARRASRAWRRSSARSSRARSSAWSTATRRRTHPQFQLKLEAIGYGFLIPVFFVTSGMRFDLNALLDNPSTLVKVPIFLLALLVVRGLPAIVYRPLVGTRGAAVAGLLQATSLPFIVAATQIGRCHPRHRRCHRRRLRGRRTPVGPALSDDRARPPADGRSQDACPRWPTRPPTRPYGTPKPITKR